MMICYHRLLWKWDMHPHASVSEWHFLLMHLTVKCMDVWPSRTDEHFNYCDCFTEWHVMADSTMLGPPSQQLSAGLQSTVLFCHSWSSKQKLSYSDCTYPESECHVLKFAGSVLVVADTVHSRLSWSPARGSEGPVSQRQCHHHR